MKTLKKLLLILSVSTFIFFTDNVKASISSDYNNYHDEENLIYNSGIIKYDYRYAYYYAEENTVYIYSVRNNDWSDSSSYANKVSLDTYPYFYIVYNSYFTGAFTSDSVYFLWSKSPMIFNTSDNYWYSTDSQVYYAGVKYAQSNAGSANSKMANTYSTGALNNGTFVFYSNQDIYNQNGELYQKSNLPIKKIYNHVEEIDTTNLSYIRIDFDTTDTTYEDYNFINIDNVSNPFKEAYTETAWDYGVCVDPNNCYQKYVHRNNLNYLSTQSNYYLLSTFKYEDIEHAFYEETQALDYYYSYFDVSNSTDIIELTINSTAPFTISFGYLEDYNDTFITLNLKNYSGLVLYPKSSVYNGDYIFYLKDANINVFEYNNGKIVNKYENLFLPVIELEKMEYYMFNRFYLIKNNKINEESYISFDSKYFVYKLIENTSDNIIITNPNTNKDEYIDSIDNSNIIFESQKEYKNIFDMINQGKIDEEIITIFTNVYNMFRNNLLGIYIFTIIVFSIILLLIKSARR